MSITLTSSAFADGQPIPKQYSNLGTDVSPPLQWSNVPPTTKELALICYDPDAPNGHWVHWVVYHIPPGVTSLPEAMPRAEKGGLNGVLQGKNSCSSANVGYRGPKPPPGGVHHYIFTLYALDTTLDLPGGVEEKKLLGAMKGHILTTGKLTGTFQQ